MGGKQSTADPTFVSQESIEEIDSILIQSGGFLKDFEILCFKYDATDEEHLKNLQLSLNDCTSFNGDVDYSRYLLEACSNSDLERVRLLLETGVSVNARDEHGATGLHLISSLSQRIRTNDEIIEALVTEGADVNALDDGNESPLCRACRSGNTRVARTLLRHGANINIKQVPGSTPDQPTALHNACHSGSPNTVRLLLEHGADFTQPPGTRGYTPLRCALHFAMEYNSKDHFQILQQLVRAGAFVDLSDHNELSDFLTLRKRKARTTLSNFEVVRRIVNKEFDNVEKEEICPVQVMKYMIQHNALLRKEKGTHCELTCLTYQLIILFLRHLHRQSSKRTLKMLKSVILNPGLIHVMEKKASSKDVYNEEWHTLQEELHYERTRVWSLQEMCRSVIRLSVGARFEYKLNSLPLPLTIKSYLLLSELNDIQT